MDTKTCERCGREFSRPPHLSAARWPERRFCGWDCFKAWKQTLADCPICGVQFSLRVSGQRTCGSDRCRSEYRRTIVGPTASERMKADYAAGRRRPAPGISPREVALWPLLAPHGWWWRLRWAEADGDYELDFAHQERMLNVEIDGPEHRWQHKRRGPAHDQARDAELERRGWRILRITNEEVDASPEEVAARIAAWAAEVR